MKTDEKLFERAQAAFNTIKIMKGQIMNIATCDNEGNPNVAPIGSMRVVDRHTVHVLQGMLPRTLKNLESNPRAAFSVTARPSFWDFVSMLRSSDDAPMGYRVYCELTSIEDDKAVVQAEAKELLARLPRLLRGTFSRFCEKNLRRLLKFRIVEIRPTH